MNCDKNMSVGDGTVMAEDKIVFTGCKHAYLVMAHKDEFQCKFRQDEG